MDVINYSMFAMKIEFKMYGLYLPYGLIRKDAKKWHRHIYNLSLKRANSICSSDL